MKKATASISVLIISALFVSFQTYAQFNWEDQQNPGHGHGGINYQEPSPYSQSPYGTSQNTITESVRQSIRMGQRIGLSELLRLSPQAQRQIEVLSLSITAQSIQGRGQLDILSLGRPISQPLMIRRQLSEVNIQLPAMTLMSDLELSSSDEIYIESISAQIISSHNQPHNPRWEAQQPLPQQMLKLQINQEILGRGQIDLDRLVQQQLGLTLEGAEIERVVVLASPSRYGRLASVQVEMNNRLVGPSKPLTSGRRIPLQVNSYEEVRSLSLIVNGDARISEIDIRVGQVRPIMNNQRPERIVVSQEVSRVRSLNLSSLMPYESRLVRSISIEAHTLRGNSSEVTLISRMSGVLGSVLVSQVPMRPVIQLIRPVTLNELQLESLSPVIIDIIEIEFDRPLRW